MDLSNRSFVFKTRSTPEGKSTIRTCIRETLIFFYRLCDSRKYTYFFPSYLLIPPKPGSGLRKTFLSKAPEGYSEETHPFWENTPSDSDPTDDLRRKREWRVGKDDIDRLRETSQRFIGSHNYHNYTVGASYKDASSRRLMKEIEVRLLHI